MLSNYKLKEDAILAQQTRTREVRERGEEGGGGRGRWSMCTHVHPPLALGRTHEPPCTNHACICRPKSKCLMEWSVCEASHHPSHDLHAPSCTPMHPHARRPTSQCLLSWSVFAASPHPSRQRSSGWPSTTLTLTSLRS